MSRSDKPIAIVTGGAQGLGLELAKQFSSHGYKVYACDINEARLEQARQLNLSGIEFQKCDITDLNQVEILIKDVFTKEERLDLVINNAAFVKWEDYNQMTVQDDLKAMKVGYDGMVQVIRSALPYMEKQGYGQFINMGSSASKILTTYASASYNAAKAAIDIYTQSLQLSFAGTNINFTLVRPGTIRGTDFFKSSVSSTRLPRMADFMSPLTADKVAEKVFWAAQKKKQILDLPWILKPFYLLSQLMPSFTNRLFHAGGNAKSDFAE